MTFKALAGLEILLSRQWSRSSELARWRAARVGNNAVERVRISCGASAKFGCGRGKVFFSDPPEQSNLAQRAFTVARDLHPDGLAVVVAQVPCVPHPARR